MKYFLIAITVLASLSSSELLGQETEPGEWPDHKFDFMAKASLNYFDFDDLGFLEISSDAKLGVGIGMVYEWKMMERNHFRADVQYEIQSLQNSFEEGGNTSETKITNHIIGINVLPISIRAGNKFKPVLSLGGYANFILGNNIESDLNGSGFEPDFEVNRVQVGWMMAAGVYLGQKLFEIRYKQSLSDYISNIDDTNRIDQISFILIL
jgi:hypothetical protein